MKKGVEVAIQFPDYWKAGEVVDFYPSHYDGENFVRYDVKGDGFFVVGAHPDCIINMKCDVVAKCPKCGTNNRHIPCHTDSYKVKFICVICGREWMNINPINRVYP
jgi:cupin superfamily acireductone dioxygenase involved in methionine salvage